jgi:hypothetical protein
VGRWAASGGAIDTFEYITALVSVVVGLAIADMATSLHRLLRNRRRVRWDWVAPLAALVILVELFNLWWSWRGFTGDSLADLAPYFVVLVLLFLTASATLPDEVPEEGLDLRRYFDENRSYFWALYGSYITIWIGIWTLRDIAAGERISELLRSYYFDYPWIIAAFTLVFVRTRWLSGALLLITLVWVLFGFGWWTKPLTGSP